MIQIKSTSVFAGRVLYSKILNVLSRSSMILLAITIVLIILLKILGFQLSDITMVGIAGLVLILSLSTSNFIKYVAKPAYADEVFFIKVTGDDIEENQYFVREKNKLVIVNRRDIPFLKSDNDAKIKHLQIRLDAKLSPIRLSIGKKCFDVVCSRSCSYEQKEIEQLLIVCPDLATNLQNIATDLQNLPLKIRKEYPKANLERMERLFIQRTSKDSDFNLSTGYTVESLDLIN